MNQAKNKHRPVMLTEAVSWLQAKPGQWVIDATLGGGGHTAALLATGANVLAYDWDEEAITAAKTKFSAELEKKQLILVHESFVTIKSATTILPANSIISGILFDFGTSTMQLTSADRGFSFSGDGPLDMRMDTRRGVTAADMIKFLSEKELASILDSAGESESRQVAKAIKWELPSTTAELTRVVQKTKQRQKPGIHPATKTFMALRIAVNTEMAEIEEALPLAKDILPSQGRLVCISFHDGEDRLVKQAFQHWQEAGLGTQTTTKPITPSESEITRNPRSRSAKMRVFAKK